MKVQVLIVASFIVTISGQGWPFFGSQSPPGLQFNPIFNGNIPRPTLNQSSFNPGLQFNPLFQNPHPNPLPGLQFNPFLNGQHPNPNPPPGLPFNPFLNGQHPNPNPPPGLPFNPIFNGNIPSPTFNQSSFNPGLQFNPWLNGQNPNPNPPPGLQFNPFLNGQNPSLRPPGLQFNPFFNGQSSIPNRNFSNGPPFISTLPQLAHPNPFFNFFSIFRPFSAGRSISKRAIGAASQYSPYYCIPDHPQCNGSHSISVGCLSSWDTPLFRQSYVKPGKMFWKREKTIRYPGDFLPPGFVRNQTITAIKIQDRNCNGTGGYAEILPGTGVGYRTAAIRLYSTGARKGFNFYIAIYGK